MRALFHRASAQALYSNRTARALQANLTPPRRRSSQLAVITLVALVFFCCTTIFFGWNILNLEKQAPVVVQHEKLVSRIAFGSSSAHDYGSQPVWVNGVIPSDPDVWIWLGDMAYLDEPRVNCDALPDHAQCNCSANWLQQPRHSCMAGNFEHATSRMQTQLANPDYAQFLAFMCPGHRKRGLFPPPGFDPTICPKRILGTYDAHDYSWKHGNKRLPRKDDLKQIFLDAIGEAPDSPRRNSGRGIQWKYSFNQNTRGSEIDVILLDTRYYRDPLPCYTRKHFCEEITINSSHEQYAWCIDFLHGGETGTGSCCGKDEAILHEWCLHNMKLPVWKELCDSPSLGSISSAFKKLQSSLAGENFCEVLGVDQKTWLEEVLMQSDAPVKLLVSSSPLFENLNKKLRSNGDNWDCYKPAQVELLKLISKASGCVVILTGNSGYSDIQMLKKSSDSGDDPVEFTRPVYQMMASGLAMNTVKNETCEEPARGGCEFVQGPSFGLVEIESRRKHSTIRLQVRDGLTNQVTLESSLPLDSCFR